MYIYLYMYLCFCSSFNAYQKFYSPVPALCFIEYLVVEVCRTRILSVSTYLKYIYFSLKVNLANYKSLGSCWILFLFPFSIEHCTEFSLLSPSFQYFWWELSHHLYYYSVCNTFFSPLASKKVFYLYFSLSNLIMFIHFLSFVF